MPDVVYKNVVFATPFIDAVTRNCGSWLVAEAEDNKANANSGFANGLTLDIVEICAALASVNPVW